jgi:hypothetical protein
MQAISPPDNASMPLARATLDELPHLHMPVQRSPDTQAGIEPSSTSEPIGTTMSHAASIDAVASDTPLAHVQRRTLVATSPAGPDTVRSSPVSAEPFEALRQAQRERDLYPNSNASGPVARPASVAAVLQRHMLAGTQTGASRGARVVAPPAHADAAATTQRATRHLELPLVTGSTAMRHPAVTAATTTTSTTTLDRAPSAPPASSSLASQPSGASPSSPEHLYGVMPVDAEAHAGLHAAAPAAHPPTAAQHGAAVDVDGIVERAVQAMMLKLEIERERRGFARWA